MRKEFNSQRIFWVHQHGRRFIVLEHQYGRRDVLWKHSIPIDRVPKSKSCVFCSGIKFLFFPIRPFLGPFLFQGWLFSWKGVMHVTLYEVPEESHFSDSVWWLYKPAMWKCEVTWKNKISFAEEAVGNIIIKSRYQSTVGSVSHLDKYLHGFII